MGSENDNMQVSRDYQKIKQRQQERHNSVILPSKQFSSLNQKVDSEPFISQVIKKEVRSSSTPNESEMKEKKISFSS